jgi:hypothetical protein
VSGRRILITNNTLNSRFGAETASRDLALGLAAAGESVAVYTPKPGAVAEEIKRAGIPVIDKLSALPFRPEIVQGNQHLEMVDALLACPEARGVFVCHARLAWEAAPPLIGRIHRYVAVDQNCRERLLQGYAISPERVRVIFNSVDLDRFRPRSPLPARPRRALVFSNYASEETHLPAIRRACEELELPLDVIGSGVGQLADSPEDLLGDYDVVFAKARCALEAAAVGAALVLCDEVGLGPLVTAAEVAELRAWNFGMRTLKFPIEPRRIIEQLQRYDAADAKQVCNYIRAHAGLDGTIAEYRAVYEEVMHEPIRSHATELSQYHRATIRKMAAFEEELWQLRKPSRMEPLTKTAAAEVELELIHVPEHSSFAQPFWITCRITNRATQRIGSYPPAPVRMAYHWLHLDGKMAVYDGLRTELVPFLDSGAAEIYQMKIIPPPKPGKYRLAIALVQEGVRWFAEITREAVASRAFIVS